MQGSLKFPRKAICQVTIQEVVNNDLVQVSHPQSVQDLRRLPRILYHLVSWSSFSNSPSSLVGLGASQPLPSKISGVTNWLMGSKVSLVCFHHWSTRESSIHWLNSEVCAHGGISGKASGSYKGLWVMARCFLMAWASWASSNKWWVRLRTLFLGKTIRCQNDSWKDIPSIKRIANTAIKRWTGLFRTVLSWATFSV